MKNKLMSSCGLFAILFLVSGCFSALTPIKINYYDLNMPAPNPLTDTQIIIESLENMSGSGEKMRYRTNNNQQLVDDQNRWIQFPDEMIVRYLNTILGGNASDKSFRVRGQLDVFEINLTQNTASLQCSFTIFEAGTEQQQSKVYRKTLELKEQSPQAFAEAFSNAAAGLSDEMKNLIENWSKR